MSEPLRIAIAGLGTVGAGVLQVVAKNGALIARRGGRPLEIVAVSARDRAKARGVAMVQRLQAVGAAPGELGKLAPKEVESRVVAFERKVLWYAAPELDLTEDLIKALMVPVADEKPAVQDAAAKPGVGAPKANGAPKAGG